MKLYSLTNCNLHCTFAAKLPASLWTFFLWSAGIHRHSLLLSLSHSTTHKGAALLLQQRMWMNLLQTNQCSAVFSCHCLVSAQLTWNLNRCTRYYLQWKKGGKKPVKLRWNMHWKKFLLQSVFSLSLSLSPSGWHYLCQGRWPGDVRGARNALRLHRSHGNDSPQCTWR